MKRLSMAGAAALCLAVALGSHAATAQPADAAAPAEGDAAKGKTLFQQRCGICHQVSGTQATLGPVMAGVVGRKAGLDPNFAGYSKALKASNLTWTPANLDSFLAAPTKVVPGTMMVIANPQAKDRADLIAFMQTLK